MIRARSRHLKCTARDKASAISIKIVAGDWLKSQNLTNNGLNLLFNLFFEPNLVAVSSRLLLLSFVAMAYGELVQIERESFLTSATILDCVALVEVFCQFLS